MSKKTPPTSPPTVASTHQKSTKPPPRTLNRQGLEKYDNHLALVYFERGEKKELTVKQFHQMMEAGTQKLMREFRRHGINPRAPHKGTPTDKKPHTQKPP